MHILNVNTSIDPRTGGGMAERTVMMTKYLAAQGVKCSILTIKPDQSDELPKFEAGIRVKYLNKLIPRYLVPSLDLALLLRLVKQVDVIHLMGHWSLLNIYVFFVAKFLKKPYVICPAGSLNIYGRSKLLKYIYNLIIGRLIIKNASGWISITNNESTQFEGYGVDSRLVALIPNGINTNIPKNTSSALDCGFRLDTFPYILYIGRLNSIKGPDILLEAFIRVSKSISDYHLIFAGTDEGMQSSLELLSRKMNIYEKVHFIGFRGNKEKSLLYSNAKLIVVPSRHEAMSIVVLEAGALGKPVLLTNQCGFPEIKEVAPILEAEANATSLGNHLIELLSNEQNLQGFGEGLQKLVIKKYDWQVIVPLYLKLFDSLIKSKCKN